MVSLAGLATQGSDVLPDCQIQAFDKGGVEPAAQLIQDSLHLLADAQDEAVFDRHQIPATVLLDELGVTQIRQGHPTRLQAAPGRVGRWRLSLTKMGQQGGAVMVQVIKELS